MFYELMRKDLRLMRPTLIAGVTLLIAPYILSALILSSFPFWRELSMGCR